MGKSQKLKIEKRDKIKYLRVQYPPIELMDPPPNPDFYRTIPFIYLIIQVKNREKKIPFRITISDSSTTQKGK